MQTVPQSPPAAGVRPAAVAGSFYPGSPDTLRVSLAGLFAAVRGGPVPALAAAVPKAIIVPHAGYIYSGEIAAAGYARLFPAGDQITRVVLLGPTHRVYVRAIAAPAADRFATPLGALEVDRAAIASLAGLPQVIVDDRVHAQEHSLEVQLPFLQRTVPRAKIVPLAVGDVAPAVVGDVIERLWGGAETCFVISSDLSHYLPYDAARATDSSTAQLIERFQGERIGPEQACGCRAIAGMLAAAKAHGLAIERLDLRNSGDTAGPRDQVVGYGAWALNGALNGALNAHPSGAQDPR